MTDKEQIMIDGVKKECEILFECGSVDDLASYDMIKKNIKITPEIAPVDDYDIRLIANPQSPYGFTSIFKRNKNVDEWEYMGFGHSGACSVVTALLKQLARKTQECEEYKKRAVYFKDVNKQLGYKYLTIKQECEELKEENQKLEMQLCNDCGERDDYNIPCKMIRDLDYGLQKEIEENDRYRKALEEIEEYIKNFKEIDLFEDIKDIINKAKGE